jgi:hypothetical protein
MEVVFIQIVSAGTPKSVSEFGGERNSFNHLLMIGRCRAMRAPSE